MSTSTLSINATSAVAGRRRRILRLRAVVAAVVAALTVWATVVHGLGLTLRAPAGGGREATVIGATEVFLVSAIASLAGWATLALLERLTARARHLWAGLAVAVLMLSLGGPLSGAGVTAANRLALVALHVVVGAVLVPTLHRTSRGGSARRDFREPVREKD